jgi:hypothetical protein
MLSENSVDQSGCTMPKKTVSDSVITEGLSREEVEELLVTSIGEFRQAGWHYSCTVGPFFDEIGNSGRGEQYLINVFCKQMARFSECSPYRQGLVPDHLLPGEMEVKEMARKIHADISPRTVPVKPLKVYWTMDGSDGQVHSSYVSRRDGDRIVFTDGQWNLASDCYLTPAQARAALRNER